jgi:hypothetical protein
MALHRDIYWVGRQWAVTGFGVQAVDQRLKGAFDIEVTRIWEDDLPQRMRGLSWLNAEDFSKALELARARFPTPPRKKGLPLVESVLELIQPVGAEPPTSAPPPIASNIREAEPAKTKPNTNPKTTPKTTPKTNPVTNPATTPPAALPLAMELPGESPQQKSEPLAMRIEHVSAKFLPRWRIRHGAP